jgi:hypothetical protein
MTAHREDPVGPLDPRPTGHRSRALVWVLEEPGDAGEQAIDPAAVGEQDGHVLENGQHDTYENRHHR